MSSKWSTFQIIGTYRDLFLLIDQCIHIYIYSALGDHVFLDYHIDHVAAIALGVSAELSENPALVFMRNYFRNIKSLECFQYSVANLILLYKHSGSCRLDKRYIVL